jgi:hypothetical protein
MTERGGPTIQSGVIYQNSVTALMFGQLLDWTQRPQSQTIVAVRAEALTHVDDTVVTYADGHRDFIQAKESVDGEPWSGLWKDVAAEFVETSFRQGCDRIWLWFGEPDRVDSLREASDRALGAPDTVEWNSRLSVAQRSVVDDVAARTGFPPGSSELLGVFKHLTVQVASRAMIERVDAPKWMPPSSKTAADLFRLLRDRVGGHARIRREYGRKELLASLQDEDSSFALSYVSDDEVARAVGACGALLSKHKAIFGDAAVHIQRGVVSEIAAWLQSGESPGTIAMVLDHAGAGKSVVMRDVVDRLSGSGMPVVAIKADLQLTGVTSAEEVQHRLQLPDSLDRVVARLAARGGVVVIVDQIDALSLSLAHDSRTLDVVIDTIARLSAIPGVRLLISCRTFDLNNDVRLQHMETKKTFSVTELTDEELAGALRDAGLADMRLTETTRKLLRLPLHLDLYLLAGVREQPATLQDLYASLVRRALRRLENENGPNASVRAAALKSLTAAMYERQRTTMPATFFLERGGDDLHAAAVWLASEGLLLGEAGWAFRHQTLFDYLFARDFVESGRSLFEYLESSAQGLSDRSMLVQVLAYQRGTDQARYLVELSAIWAGEGIRFHLRHLLMRWFGTLPNPTPSEILWAKRLFTNDNDLKQFLRAAARSAAWFQALKPELADLLSNDTQIDEVLWFISFVLDSCQSDVIAMVRPYLRHGGVWIERCRFIVWRIREWTDPTAIDFFDDVMSAGPSQFENFFEFGDMARLDAHRTAIAVVHLLERQLEDNCSTDERPHRGIVDRLHRFVQTDLDQALEIFAVSAPVTWLDGVVSLLERALAPAVDDANDRWFWHDNLSFAADDLAVGFEASLLRSVLQALVTVGGTDDHSFERLTRRLATVPSVTAQNILAHAYASLAPLHSAEAARFLLGDQRRMWLGRAAAGNTRRLISSIHPHLSSADHIAIEDAIKSYTELRADDSKDDRKRAEWERLCLLSAIPRQLMSDATRRNWQELQRKYSNVDLSPDVGRVRMLHEHSPINPANAAKMRDENWLAAMRKHTQTSTSGSRILRSARSLAQILQEEAKKAPTRFSSLAARLPDDVDDVYVAALIGGLSEAHAPVGTIAGIVRRFACDRSRDLRREVAWALRNYVEDVPADLIDLLESWVRDDSLADDHERQTLDYLNTERGSIFLTLMATLRQQRSQVAATRRRDLFESVIVDGTIALRAAAIEELRYEFSVSRDDALRMFERLTAGFDDTLLRAQYLTDLLEAGIWKSFGRVQPLIFKLIDSADDKHQDEGARLITIAAISPKALTDSELAAARKVVERLIAEGHSPHRQSLARVLAYNVASLEADYCFVQLRKLLEEDDPKVQHLVATAFEQMSMRDITRRFAFLSEFTRSAAMANGLRLFANYLLEHGMTDPERALTLIEQSLENNHPGDGSRWFDGEQFIRLVLRIDTHPLSPETLRRRAMDVFDRLMERYGDLADSVLDEWDRR